ncbi:MAG: hypothetical protein EOP37_09545 [Rubrivivax sp.]|nr:MAG: hypothetical protein EOP37_09545 [Rubrivivax sp.]
MPVERVVGEAYLRRTDVEGVGSIRLASKVCPEGKLIAEVVSVAMPGGGFAAAGKASLTVMVEDVEDRFTRNRVLRQLGIDCEDD